jgi:hypothetical protein
MPRKPIVRHTLAPCRLAFPRVDPASAFPEPTKSLTARTLNSATLLTCLAVMALTHVAEPFNILPIAGWGLPNSPGHYVDLVSTVAGVILLLSAGIVRLFSGSATPP